jgi:hypothetical protein
MHKVFGLLIAVGLLVSGAALADDKQDGNVRGSGRVVPVLPQ